MKSGAKSILFFLLFFIPYLLFGIYLGNKKVSIFKTASTQAEKPDLDWFLRWGDSPLNAAGIPVWTVHDSTLDRWHSFRRFFEPLKKKDRVLWLRTTLPKSNHAQPTLAFWGVIQTAEIYVDRKKIYEEKADNPVKVDILKWHLVSLPQDYAGKHMYIRMTSALKNKIGLIGEIYLGPATKLFPYMLAKDFVTIMPGYFYGVLGIVSFFLFLLRLRRRPYFLLFFGFFVYHVGILEIMIAPSMQILLNSPEITYYLYPAALYLFPVGLYAFLEQILTHYARIFRSLWLVHLAVFCTAFSIDIVFNTTPFTMIRYYAVVVVLSILTTYVILMHNAVKNGKEAKVFAVAGTVLGITGLHDTLMQSGVFDGVIKDLLLFQFGMLFFVFSMIYLVERRFQKTQIDLEQYSYELKRINKKLAIYSKTLEKEVKERTKKLIQKNIRLQKALKELGETQAQLVMKEKMASLGNLVAGVAHEINNPMGAIKSATNVLERLEKRMTSPDSGNEGKTEQILHIYKQNLDILSIASDRISKIVTSLKNFARLDEAEFQEVDIHQGIDNTLVLLNHTFKDRIRVRKKYGTISPVACFPDQLNQVFMNILQNAAQSIKARGRISIKTYATEDRIKIEISDSGTGISKKNLQKIFDPGFTTKGVGVGTGLGLSISYQIIKKHGGEILVESQIGQGSTFTIELPGTGKEKTQA